MVSISSNFKALFFQGFLTSSHHQNKHVQLPKQSFTRNMILQGPKLLLNNFFVCTDLCIILSCLFSDGYICFCIFAFWCGKELLMILAQNFKHLCTLLEKQPWHYYKRKKKRQEAATLCTRMVLNVYTSPMYFGSFFTHCKCKIWVKYDRKSVIG